jgi:hypothetical protein
MCHNFANNSGRNSCYFEKLDSHPDLHILYFRPILSQPAAKSPLYSTFFNYLSRFNNKYTSMASLVLPPIRNNPDKIQLARISHVYQAHPDLERWKVFAKDFGFEFVAESDKQVFYRGYGKDPYICVASQSTSGGKEFGGVAFLANSEADFEKASKLSGAQVVDLSSAPGGGTMVTIPIPSGSNIHVVFGQQGRDAPAKVITATEIHKSGFNTSFQKSRKGGL